MTAPTPEPGTHDSFRDWPRIPPLPKDVARQLWNGVRSFGHECNNALTAAHAARDVTALLLSDERAIKRLERVERQLLKLQLLLRQTQGLAWRGDVDDDTLALVIRDVDAAAAECDRQVRWPAHDVVKRLCSELTPGRLRLLLINVARATRAGGVVTLRPRLHTGDSVVLIEASVEDPSIAGGAGQLGIVWSSVASALAEIGVALHLQQDDETLQLAVIKDAAS